MSQDESTAPVATQDSTAADGGESLVQEFETFMDDGEDSQYESEPAQGQGEPSQEAQKEEAKSQDQEQVETPKPAGKEAPSWWTKEEKEAWSKAAPEVQDAFLRRTQQIEQFAKDSESARNFSAAMRPIGEAIFKHSDYLKTASVNGQPLAGNPRLIASEIDSLFNLKKMAFSDPQGLMRELADFYATRGVNIADLFQQQGEGAQWQDPALLQLRKEAAQARAAAEAVQQRMTQQEAAQRNAMEQQATQNLAMGVVNMSEAKDDAGNALYPHLHGENAQAVGTIMGKFLRANAQGGRITPGLFAQAYNAAVFANDATREAEIALRAEKRLQDYKTRSDRAKKAAGITPRNDVGAGEAMGDMDLDQALEAAWQKMQAGK